MKKVGVLVLLVFVVGLVSASVSVQDFSLKDSYSPYENIFGGINLTIVDEEINSDLSTNILNQKISLRGFLEANNIRKGISYSCNTNDCVDNYVFSGGVSVKTIDFAGEEYFGFVLYGQEGVDVRIVNFSFGISSNFGEKGRVPLELKFFEEGEVWKFDRASGNFGQAMWGCYDTNVNHELGDIGSTKYCEKINISETPALEVGADISGSGSGNVRMSIYDESNLPVGNCDYNPETASLCEVSFNDGFFLGRYSVCVNANSDTGYKIKSERDGERCGWLGLPSAQNSTLDYAIFAKQGLYAPAQDIVIDGGEVDGLVADANSFLNERYNWRCADGCVLPVLAKGTSQELVISNVELKYLTDIGVTSDEVYDIQRISAKVDFFGGLDLDLLGFHAGEKGEKSFELYLDDEKLIDENIVVLPAPTIGSIFPQNPSAGVSTDFTVFIDSEYNVTSYVWDFGDGTRKTTSGNSVTHSYGAIKGYTLVLNVTDKQGFTASKSFAIIAGSPEQVISNTIVEKRSDLNKTLSDIGEFVLWQADGLSNVLNISYYESELDRLEKARLNASLESEFLAIAISLQELNVPSGVSVSESSSGLLINLEDINPQSVAAIADGSVGNFADDYKNAIYQWQVDNIVASILMKKISVVRGDDRNVILNVYSVNLTSNSGEKSYFIIDKRLVDVVFESQDSSVKSAGNFSSAVILNGNSAKNFEFYIEEDVVFFISPRLSLFTIGAEIGACNYNGECEKNLGENSKNCRNDCKPIGRAVLYIVLILVFILVVYTILQMWYKTKYESHLFKDRKFLFNVLMFINNARARGMGDYQIRELLKKQDWSGEQIVYALKKSRGEGTGLPEIIPIGRFLAYLRQRSANKKIVTGNVRQIRGKFNKPLR